MQPRTSLGRVMGYISNGESYRVLLAVGKEIVERRDVMFCESDGSKAVHLGDNVEAGGDGRQGGDSPPESAAAFLVLTPSSPGGRGVRQPPAGVTPEVQCAIDAARLLTGDLASGDESSSEEDEVVEPYPGHKRRPPHRNGTEGVGESANTTAMVHPGKPIIVRDLPPPPKTVA